MGYVLCPRCGAKIQRIHEFSGPVDGREALLAGLNAHLRVVHLEPPLKQLPAARWA